MVPQIRNNDMIDAILADVEKRISSKADLSWFNLHNRRFKETLVSLLSEVPPPAKVVELGASPGHLTLAMKALGYDVTGLDLAPDRFIFDMWAEDIKICCADLETGSLPFGNSIFDCAVLTEVIEHLEPKSLPLLFSEIYRILSPNGNLFLSTPNISTLDNRLLRAIGKYSLYEEHKREYAMDEVVMLIKASAFKITKKWYSKNRDVVTHFVMDKFISKDHVIIGFFKKPNWKNFGRLITLPIKCLIPSTRSTIFVIAKKIE